MRRSKMCNNENCKCENCNCESCECSEEFLEKFGLTVQKMDMSSVDGRI